MTRDNFAKRFTEFCNTISDIKSDFAKKLNITPQALQKYLKGERMPLPDLLEKLNSLGCNINWLLTGEGEMIKSISNIKTKSKQIPILAEVECGVPIYSQITNDTIKYIEITDINYYFNPFVVIAKGDSMSPYINSGDMLVCSDEPEKVKDGKAVVINYKTIPDHYSSNAKLIKYLDDDKIMCYSINTKFAPVIVKKSEIYKIYKVVRIIREVR